MSGTLLLALAFGLPAPVSAQHFPSDEALELMLRYLVEDSHTPGIVLGVLEADGSTRVFSFGSGGPDTRPLSSRSVFDIGSINKTFTATILADMVLRGEVGLQDPVAAYLPDSVRVPSLGGREITLLDLATHTSGLPRLPDNYRPPDMRDPFADYTLETLHGFLGEHALRREPGAEYEYSNLGYGLLGHALARAAGMPYRQLVRERITEPLGMDATDYAVDGGGAEWMVWGHKYGRPVPYWRATEAIEGAGGLRSSMDDMLVYLRANAGMMGTPLLEAMRLAQEVRGEVQGRQYGFSWGIRTFPGRSPVTMHGGATGGFTARIGFIQDTGIGLVWLANSNGVDANLEDLLVFDPPPGDWGDIPVEPETLGRLTGDYQSDSGEAHYYVRLEKEGYLTYQRRGLPRARLYATSDSTFYLLSGPWSFTFRAPEAGGVMDMVLEVDQRASGREERRTARRVGSDSPSPAVVAGHAGLLIALARGAEPVVWEVYSWGPVAWALMGLVLVAGVLVLVWRMFVWMRHRKAQRV